MPLSVVFALLLEGCIGGVGDRGLLIVEDSASLPGRPCDVSGAVECEIVGFDEVVLDTRGSEPIPVGLPAMDSRGRVFLATYERGVVGVWGADGTFIQRVGRQGRGPGEIHGAPSVWVDPGDSLHTMSNDDTWTVFAPPDYEYVRRMSEAGLPFFRFGAFLGSGMFVIAEGSPLFRVVDKEGEVVYSFEASTPADNQIAHRVVASAMDARSFWAVAQYRMVLEKWSVDGTLLRSIDVVGSVFPDRDVDQMSMDRAIKVGMFPPPTIVDLKIARNGVAWVTGALPDPRGFDPRLSPANAYQADELNRSHDFFIEAISLKTGRVLASTVTDRLDESTFAFVRGPTGYRYGDDGVFPRHSFIRLALRSIGS